MTNTVLDNNTTPRYVVMVSTAKMPLSVKDPHYRNIALVETDGTMPKMISPRARHLVRIVDAAYGVHVGRTNRSYGYNRLQEMRQEAERLNRQ